MRTLSRSTLLSTNAAGKMIVSAFDTANCAASCEPASLSSTACSITITNPSLRCAALLSHAMRLGSFESSSKSLSPNLRQLDLFLDVCSHDADCHKALSLNEHWKAFRCCNR